MEERGGGRERGRGGGGEEEVDACPHVLPIVKSMYLDQTELAMP